jgi:transposase InsO family protein
VPWPDSTALIRKVRQLKFDPVVFSRRAMGFAAFEGPPTSEQVQAFLGRTIAQAGAAPKHLVCDKGSQFWCEGFKAWCKRRGIQPRFGAVGQHGSIAVIERLILTVKTILGCLPLVPLRADAFRREVAATLGWYNEHRPHTKLGGRTPNEVYFQRHPANRRPRFETRNRWPRGSPCAAPWALARAKPGARVELDVEFQDGRRHLPVVRLRRVA